jgi:hypothetical protein
MCNVQEVCYFNDTPSLDAFWFDASFVLEQLLSAGSCVEYLTNKFPLLTLDMPVEEGAGQSFSTMRCLHILVAEW